MGRKITEITRRDIIDLLKNGFIETEFYNKPHPDFFEYMESEDQEYKITAYGRLDEIEFLERIFPLDMMPSYDSRFVNARKDIIQHTINNDDWEPDWIYKDERLNILNGTDDTFMNFICEIFHPAVRNEKEPWKSFLEKFNELLKCDGFEIYPSEHISGRSVYRWREIVSGKRIVQKQISSIKINFDSDYINSQVDIMYNNIDTAPNVAIGKAKELIETCCKTILDEMDIHYSSDIDLNPLMKKACECIGLIPKNGEGITNEQKIANKILGNLINIAHGMAELRNFYGDGHGKNKSFKSLPPRYANLAVGASVAAVHFIWDTYNERKNKNSGGKNDCT